MIYIFKMPLLYVKINSFTKTDNKICDDCLHKFYTIFKRIDFCTNNVDFENMYHQ